MARNPRYRFLFGPVSISAEYQTRSQQLPVSLPRCNAYQDELARWVRPRHPFRGPPVEGREGSAARISDPVRLAELLMQIEGAQKSFPVLIRQCLKLGSRLIGFNVDPNFSNAIDCLIYVDLLASDPRSLSRYMGRDGHEAFLDHHRATML